MRNTKGLRRAAIASATAVLLVLALLAAPAFANHGNQRLEVTPEVASGRQGTQHTLTATLYQGNTDVAGGANNSTGAIVIDFAIESGPNQGEAYNCTIIVGSSDCSISYHGDEGVGTDTIRGSVRGDAVDQGEGRYAGPTDCPAPPDPSQPGSSSSGPETDCASGTSQAGDTPESQADPTDVVEMRWTQSVTGSVCLDAEPNEETNPSGSSHEIQIVATDGQKIADADGVHDCDGTARAGLRLDLELGDDDPNAFFETVNGAPTNASGGGPNTVTCTTTGQGLCEATIRTVATNAEGTNAVTITVAGDVGSDPIPTDNQETVEKTWERSGELATIDASPEADTNEVGVQHIVGARALDGFGNPVPGVTVSFQVTAGPHSDNDLDGDGNTPSGYFGRCTTGGHGTCSQPYTGSETGTDGITVFEDDDSDFRYDMPVAGMGDEPSDEVEKTWVAAGQGTQRVRLEVETDPDNDNVDENGDCDGDRQPPISEATWPDRANPNQVARDPAHKICAERFGANDAPHVGPVTFRITSGPGHLTDATGRLDLGRELRVDEGTDGYNVTYLSSTQTGDTAVEATANAARDTGTVPWTAAASTARTIDLAPETATNEAGSEHEVTATVRDRFGNPVEGVRVTFTEDGAGRFVEGGSNSIRTTGPQGRATTRTTSASNETGGQSITAALSASSTECEEAADRPEPGDPAGECSDTVTNRWRQDDDEPSRPARCERPGVICGDGGDNAINGTDGDDIIYAFGGDDTVDGGGGDDVIYLGNGNDVGLGGDGDDIVRGQRGKDILRGGSGNDLLSGNLWHDTLIGNEGRDLLRGGRGRDVARGNLGHDDVHGGRHNDTLKGGWGNDRINGDRGHDSLFGDRGHDTLNGGAGRDTCRPGRGRDRVRRCES